MLSLHSIFIIYIDSDSPIVKHDYDNNCNMTFWPNYAVFQITTAILELLEKNITF